MTDQNNQNNLPDPLQTPELPSDTGHSLPSDTMTEEEHTNALPVVQETVEENVEEQNNQ